MLHSSLFAIGIIGGADGPTTIFVTGPERAAVIAAASAVVIGIAFVMVYFGRRKK